MLKELTEWTKLKYLKNIKDKKAFNHDSSLWKELIIFFNKSNNKKNSILEKDNINDYIISLLLTDWYIKENENIKDYDPNEYYSITPKWELYLKQYDNFFKRLYICIWVDYNIIWTIFVSIISWIIGSVLTILFQK